MDPRPVKVAVVDDEPAVRKALTRLLRAAGIDAIGYASGQDFLAALAHQRFDCLVLDLQMPGMSGLDVQRVAVLPTVVISARDDREAREACMAAGACAYLAKPVDDGALLEAVHAASMRAQCGS
jgi:FixJ family two-component response regulator